MKYWVLDLHGKKIPLWTWDFETYYQDGPKAYSLRNRKLTTTMYVRDKRFKSHGCAFIDPDGNKFWVTHDDLQKFFNSIDWNEVAILGQNNYFDALIGHDHYGVIAGYYCDTMSMSYGEWGSRTPGNLNAISARLGTGSKIEGALESTANIRDLSPEQEEALVPYALNDAQVTLDSFRKMYYESGYPTNEMHIIDTTIRAYAVPVLDVNHALCRAEIEDEERRIKTLLNSNLLGDIEFSDDCASKLREDGIEAILRSRPCFAELLRHRGVEPPTKPAKDSKTGEFKYDEDGKQIKTYAFAKTDVELLNLVDDPRVSDLVLAWTGLKSTLRKNRAERLIDHTKGYRKLPVPLKYCGAHTFRWSGWDDINLQNLPSGRDGRGKRLREAITAPPGYVLVVCDSSQIECRTNAWFWQQKDLLTTFIEGGDPYSTIASMMYGVEVTKDNENSHLRHVGKAMELGLGFGMGVDRFYNGCQSGGLIGQKIPMTYEECDRAVYFWRQNRQKIAAGWDTLRDCLHIMMDPVADFQLGPVNFEHNRMFMPNELYMHYRDLHYRKITRPDGREVNEMVFRASTSKSGEVNWNKIYGAKLNENIVQSLARIIVAEQAIEIAKRYRIVLLVHDEVIFLAKEEEADEALEFGLAKLKEPRTWCPDIPLDAEGGYAKNYSK